jgi:hypothetical protein
MVREVESTRFPDFGHRRLVREGFLVLIAPVDAQVPQKGSCGQDHSSLEAALWNGQFCTHSASGDSVFCLRMRFLIY